jgi:hypothetical protein
VLDDAPDRQRTPARRLACLLLGQTERGSTDGGELLVDVVESCAAAVQWCLEPTEGLWPLLEGALRIDQVKMATTDEGPARVRASWTVTVRIIDADAVRELARSACLVGDATARADVDAGFATAWNRAADPYAPLHPIPGITWASAGVEVEHLLRHPTR